MRTKNQFTCGIQRHDDVSMTKSSSSLVTFDTNFDQQSFIQMTNSPKLSSTPSPLYSRQAIKDKHATLVESFRVQFCSSNITCFCSASKATDAIIFTTGRALEKHLLHLESQCQICVQCVTSQRKKKLLKYNCQAYKMFKFQITNFYLLTIQSKG